MKAAALQPLPPALEKILATLLKTTDTIQYNKVIQQLVFLHFFNTKVLESFTYDAKN